MENYISIYNSIIGKTQTFPFNEEEIEQVKKTLIYNESVGDLVSLVYHSSNESEDDILFTSAVSYTLKSKTYQNGSSLGMNSYYLYLSRGNGDGFIGMCGSSKAKNIEEAHNSSAIHYSAMVSHYVEYEKKNRVVCGGSNYTKPKKRKKK